MKFLTWGTKVRFIFQRMGFKEISVLFELRGAYKNWAIKSYIPPNLHSLIQVHKDFIKKIRLKGVQDKNSVAYF